MKASPTARTLAYFRKLGLRSAVVEKWNQHAKVRQDLFGWCDGISLQPGQLPCVQLTPDVWLPEFGIIGWQACAGASHSARKAKIMTLESARDWCSAGGVLFVVSWSRKGPRGRRKTWQVRIEEIKL